VDGFLVEPQNQDRAGTTWELGHEWLLEEATPSSRGFAVVHQKTTGLLGSATKPRPKTRRGGAATEAGSTTQEGRSDRLGRSNHLGGGLTGLVAAAEKLQSGGHASGS
jgi:hypothetical protein